MKSEDAALWRDQARTARVLCVDDDDAFRIGMRARLDAAGFEVVGEAATGEAGLALARTTAPDVALMDIHLPGYGGIEATRRISSALPETRVLICSSSAEERDVVNAIIAGAVGYVLKTAPLDEVAAAIRAAADGDSLLSPSIAAHLLRRVRDDVRGHAHVEAAPQLSARDLAVLRLLADGKDNAEIAHILCLSVKTVKNNVTHVLRTLDLQNRTEAAVYAVRSGLG